MFRAVIFCLSFVGSSMAAAESFSVEQMPIGADVTVPPTARTIVPMGARVKYVQVTPSAPFLYSFKGLSTISIQPSLIKGDSSSAKSIHMEIESDKAVTVAR